MNKMNVLSKVNGSIKRIGFKAQKHSPEILVVAGIVGVVTSTVMACRATTKIEKILDTTKEKVDMIHDAAEKQVVNGEEYTKKDAGKDLAKVYLQTGVGFVKVYGPSIALGTLSILSILKSHDILRKRNVALAAAYTAVDKSFKEYRNRVIERFGEGLDRELRYNIKAETVEETVVDEETGKKKKVKKTVEYVDGNLSDRSPYAKFFDELSEEWTDDPEYNLMFLVKQQRYANDLLRAKGRVFLNDVYKMLGLPETKAGQVMGWVWDPKNEDMDSYIDFGIFETRRPNQRFVNGFEPIILLDFNVDCNVWETM